jgi:iron complex outermembrane receptor protein
VYDGFSAQGRGFVNDLLTFNALQTRDITDNRSADMTSYKNDQTLVSFLGRINYAFANRYNATLSFRRDGSSKFGANNKWANFPSASVAWKISEEDFLKGNKYINDLKLRAGFGITGNQQGLGALNSVRLVNPSGTTFFGGVVIPNYAITQNENPDLRWETRQMFNVGLDFAILNNRLSGTIEYFNGNTKDLLFGYGVPTPPYPFNSIVANVGTINNQGIELSLNYKAYTSRDWDVVLAGNFTANRTKVINLSGQLNSVQLATDTVGWGSGGTTGVASTNNGISYLIKGQPLGTFFLFKNAGVDAYGEQIITDINKNGRVDDGDLSGDRYIAGQVLPKFTYAFTPTVRYKALDVAFVFRGAGGHHIYNARRAQLSALGNLGQTNVLKTAPGIGINNIEYASDLWLEKGDFFRLDNLTAGYRFKTGSIKYVESMRLSVTATNLFVISGYEGMDPELRQDGGAGTGIDFGIFPRTRTIAVGLQVNFK